jgi:hypothetical protein
MKHLFSSLVAVLIFVSGHAQISITASDMPVAGDMLGYGIASTTGVTISPGDSGANFAWNYALTPVGQSIDSYKTAEQVNLLYTLTVGSSAFGYEVADSIPGIGAILPVTIQQLYTFFEEKSSPSRYEAMAFAANISGLPAAFQYSQPDVWYYFPLTYLNYDSTAYSLDIALDTTGIKESGYRKTRVDGWGTIVTPYFTTPVNCIRVRSEKHEIDSVSFSGFTFGIPNNTVEYKWLVNGSHFPALWVTSSLIGGSETITSIWYRDTVIDTSTMINNAAPTVVKARTDIIAYPNPTASGLTTIDVPADWKSFIIALFDMNGKEVAVFRNDRNINIQSLSSGQYVARVVSGANVAYIPITR